MTDAYARGQDPKTSHEAAAAMRGSIAGRMEALVLEAIRTLGGKATAYQCVVQVQKTHPEIDSNTITPRLKPLEAKNLIERTEERGPGRGSRTQIVWAIVGHRPPPGQLFDVAPLPHQLPLTGRADP